MTNKIYFTSFVLYNYTLLNCKNKVFYFKYNKNYKKLSNNKIE